MHSILRSFRVGLSLGCAAVALPAYAQQSAVPSPDAPVGGVSATARDSASAGDIIVTAQRRDESLSKTPVAVAVVTGDTLAKAQIVSELDLRTATPGLTIKASSGSNQLNYALRGQSLDPFSASRPGVLPYINEVQIGGGGGASAFYDMQSIQVLKGPQGTLFGRSATGGAVLFTTEQPKDEFGGYLSLLGGNYGARKIEGALNIPLSPDMVLVRVAGFYSERNGFQKNLYDGRRLGDYERYGLRGSVKMESGAVTNNLVVDYFNGKGSGIIPVLSGVIPTGFPLAALYAGVATPQDRATGIATLQAFLPPAFAPLVPPFYDGYFAAPGRPAGGVNQVLAEQAARGPFKVSSDALNVFRTKNLIITNKTVFEIAPETEIRNIIGYTNLKSFNAFEVDGTPYGIVQNNFANGNGRGVRNLTKQFSEELQIAGKGLGGRLDYVVGGYFSDESVLQNNYTVVLDLLFGGSVSDYLARLKNKTYAGYAQGTYQLNDSGLAATIGARYTSEKVRKLTLPGDSNRVTLGDPAPAGFSYDKSATFNKLSWAFGVQNQFNPNTLVYATTRRAYKSGGFNAAALPKNGPAANGGDSVAAEKMTDVEVGLKYRDNANGLPKRISIAAYYEWIKGRQTITYYFLNNSTQGATANVPSSKVYGLEIDGQIGPVSGFTLGGSFNYTHARFGAEPVVIIGAPPVRFDAYPDTPKLSGSVYAEYAVPISGTIEAVVHGDLYAQSKANSSTRIEANQGSVLPGYVLANFRVGLNDDEAGWSLTANLKNAFNKVHYVGGLPLGQILSLNTRVPGDPRTFTVEARFNF